METPQRSYLQRCYPQIKRVLVVERHPQVRSALADLVESEPGLELAGTAATPQEALMLAARLRPDVVLIDVDMPDRAGEHLEQLLSRMLPRALLVRLSALSDPRQVRRKTSRPSLLKSETPDLFRSLTNEISVGKEPRFPNPSELHGPPE
jgi:DNA-binding NarL/FixJ family response regulator